MCLLTQEMVVVNRGKVFLNYENHNASLYSKRPSRSYYKQPEGLVCFSAVPQVFISSVLMVSQSINLGLQEVSVHLFEKATRACDISIQRQQS